MIKPEEADALIRGSVLSYCDHFIADMLAKLNIPEQDRDQLTRANERFKQSLSSRA